MSTTEGVVPMQYLNEWHDYLRVGLFFLSLWCCVTLIKRYRHNRDRWNVKTLDYWYALLMWTLVGMTFSVQGVYFDRDVTPALVAVTAAVLTTGKGLKRKGSWGGED